MNKNFIENFNKTMWGIGADTIVRAVGAGLMDIPLVNKKITDTQYNQGLVVDAGALGYSMEDKSSDIGIRLCKTFFAAISRMLSQYKKTDVNLATVFEVNDTFSNFLFAAIVEYHENEDPTEPGNWSYVMTFNEDDVKAIERKKTTNKILSNSKEFQPIFLEVASEVGGTQIQSSSYINDICVLVIKALKMVLDREAVADEVVDIEFDGYFVASVAVEDDEKVMSITPDGTLKAVIKNDSWIEK